MSRANQLQIRERYKLIRNTKGPSKRVCFIGKDRIDDSYHFARKKKGKETFQLFTLQDENIERVKGRRK